MMPIGKPIVTAVRMRVAEAAAMAGGRDQAALMEAAGAAVARETARFAGDRAILVLAGPGNNGGDAYVAARLLAGRGHDVIVGAHGWPGDGAAAKMAKLWRGEIVAIDNASPRPVLVDGVFGTGLSRALDPALGETLARLTAAAETIVAIDLPSGVVTGTGADLGVAREATVTVALGALKPGHVIGRGAVACGQVILADIGVSAASDWATIARPRIAPPPPNAHKFSRGMIAVIGGAMAGAARLAAHAAIAAGAGYVVLAGHDLAPGPLDAVVHRDLGEEDALATLLADDRVGAVVIGPGLGRDDRGQAVLDAALASPRPLVIDGDALTLLGDAAAARLAGRAHATILTPHSGEFDRMFGRGDGGKIERTLGAAAASRATIVHKGYDTVIAAPDGRVVVATGASPWLSTAGTGDVLAGTIAARLAARGGDPASEGVWLHGRAAGLAGVAFAADDLAAHLPLALAECL